MCGIAGIYDRYLNTSKLNHHLGVMGKLIEHRGPDDKGKWSHQNGFVGFAHQRLSIIDLSENGSQPMTDNFGNWIVFNGEIYNYKELIQELGPRNFRTKSDTEVILLAYKKWGEKCVDKFRGMFAFAIWDEEKQYLFCARDHFGIKPFYYYEDGDRFYFASEIKALLPFLPLIETNKEGLKDYLTFQLCLGEKTMFNFVKELLPANTLTFSKKGLAIKKYWEVYYDPDFSKSSSYFEKEFSALLEESVQYHLTGDVPIGAYVSGGYDSSSLAVLASKDKTNGNLLGFTGKFSKYGAEFDESIHAHEVARLNNFDLKTIDITAQDFEANIKKVIYHLDQPVAGPGSFSQFMVSKLASQHRKVVLGGQGGDEIFGGYTRYLVAYFEQCIKAAINGNSNNGNFVVTYESIIPNLTSLKGYKPMIKQFWKNGLFESMDRRYFQLINRAPNLDKEVNWDELEFYSSRKSFLDIFNGENIKKESYFDRMTHFDFKTLLPGLLHVEDRMSMAHGLESRVPLLDKKIVELAATIPADIKFKNGEMKHIFKKVVKPYLPNSVYNRTDKMGFPTPINDWFRDDLKDFVTDVLSSNSALNRRYINNEIVLKNIAKEGKFDRNIWGLFSLELWQQEFHDKAQQYKQLIK
tara:strand:+ start:11150 stop:13060 length:1911 start_codon:yes stop_codon:yes gene_type:complete